MVIVSRWGGYIQKTYRGHYITNPNNALLQDKSLIFIIFLHCFIPPNMGNLTHLAVLDPEIKPFERLIFPTKYSESPKVESRLAIGQVKKMTPDIAPAWKPQP